MMVICEVNENTTGI